MSKQKVHGFLHGFCQIKSTENYHLPTSILYVLRKEILDKKEKVSVYLSIDTYNTITSRPKEWRQLLKIILRSSWVRYENVPTWTMTYRMKALQNTAPKFSSRQSVFQNKIMQVEWCEDRKQNEAFILMNGQIYQVVIH